MLVSMLEILEMGSPNAERAARVDARFPQGKYFGSSLSDERATGRESQKFPEVGFMSMEGYIIHRIATNSKEVAQQTVPQRVPNNFLKYSSLSTG